MTDSVAPASVLCAGVRLSYGRRPALQDITLQVEDGVTALVGPNGAGKTSLLKVLLGDLRPHAGTVRVVGQDTAQRRREVMRTVGWLPQKPDLPAGISAIDFVTYAGWLKGLRWSDAQKAATAALEAVHLTSRADERVGRLSGGMQRRLAFAAATVHRPSVLLLDEPMNGLDPEQRLEMREFIRRYAVGSTVVLSTHILADLEDLADRIVLLASGRIKLAVDFRSFAQRAGGNGTGLEAAYLQVINDGQDSRRGC